MRVTARSSELRRPMAAAVAAVIGALAFMFWASQAGASGAAPTADAGGPYVIAEGDQLNLSASGSTDPELDPLTYEWDLDNDGAYDDATGENPVVAWELLASIGVNDDGARTIAVRVDDGTSTATDTASLTIADRAPTVSLIGSSAAVAGQPYELTVEIDDPGADTVSSWVLSWGDGAIDTGSGDPGTRTHTYAVDGLSHGITIQVTNEDGTWATSDAVVAMYDTANTVKRFASVSGANVTTMATSAVASPYDLTIGPDGLIYVTGVDSNTVVRFDPATNTYVDTFVTAGSGGLDDPKGLTFGPDGNLYVISFATDQVLRYDGSTGAYVDVFVGSSTLNGPTDLLFAPDGTLLVSDNNDDNIEQYDGSTGASLGVFATASPGNGPAGMTIGPDGNLYVAMFTDDTVKEFDGSTGAFVGTFVGSGLGTAHHPVFGPDGDLWVGDYATDQLKRFDGTTGASLGARVTDSSPAGPFGFAFLPDKQVRVTAGFEVNSTGNASDTSIGDGVCNTGGFSVSAQPECTLRAALQEANAAADADIITFDIPSGDGGHSGGVWTIGVSGSAFPWITQTVTIDGTSAPTYTTSPVIVVDGSALGGSHVALGLSGAASDSVVRGLSIVDFTDDAISTDADRVTIADNHLGVLPNGTTAPGQGSENVAIFGGTGTIVEDNLIGAATNANIALTGTATEVIIRGNTIGTDPGGTLNFGGSQGIWTNASGTLTIGGGDAGDANVVANSTFWGIQVNGSSGEVAILGNEIRDNGFLGIDLADAGDPGTGVTANDAGDADSGANTLLNFPVLGALVEAAGTVTANFTLDAPTATYRIDFFTNPGGTDLSGYGEGETPAGFGYIAHPGGGSASFSLTVPGSAGDDFTATATRITGVSGDGVTSELSAPATATSAVGPPVADAGGAYNLTEGDSVGLDASGSYDPQLDPLTYQWDLDNDGTYGDVTGETPTVTWATLQAWGIDDDGTHPIGLRVTDGADSATASTSIIVTNAQPVITVTGPGTVDPGVLYGVSIAATDPGDDTITGYTIHWGDGTVSTVIGGLPAADTHTYSAAGVRSIVVEVSDEDGTWTTADLVVSSFDGADHAGRYDLDDGDFVANLGASSGLNLAAGTAVGLDGDLYTANYSASAVEQFDPDTNTHVGRFVAAGTGGLTNPNDVVVEPGGDLLVSDWTDDDVLRFDGSTGAFQSTFIAAGTGGLDGAAGMAVGADGYLYVSSWNTNAVLRFNLSTGAFVDTFVAAGSGGLSGPERMTWSMAGDLLVASSGTDEIKRYDGSTGAYLGNFVSAGLGGLNYPTGVALAPDGDVLVDSRLTDEVKRYHGTTGAYEGDVVGAGLGGLDGPAYTTFVPDHLVAVGAAAGSAATNLVMVTSNGGFTAGNDSAKRTLFESWGWTVTAIDDGSNASAFTAAAAANDVMFVSDSIGGGSSNFRGLDIGLVSESFGGWYRLLYGGSNDAAWTNGTTIDIVDNSHYITSPFSTGSLTVQTTSQDINYWDGNATALPAGVTTLADGPGSTNHFALHVADTGGQLYSANTAANRRVWFPTDAADPAFFNSDYETLLERSLDWAAGNDVVAGPSGCPAGDSDGDGLQDCAEDANTDGDDNPATNPGPDTDGDTIPNHLDADDDGDGTPTASENADPNADGDPRDALDSDRDSQPDWLDLPTGTSGGTVATTQKISETEGGFGGGLTTNDHFGRAVASIGDLDGDGVGDLAVGAHWDNDGGADRGAVHILFLNADGTVKAHQKISDTEGGFSATLDNSDEFGIAIGGLGDLDGDAIPDVVVGAHQDDDGPGGNYGAVYVLFLNADGTVKAHQKISDTEGGLSTAFDANDRFGSSVARIGDLDGDGLNDIVVGAKDDDDGGSNKGAVYVLFLNADGTVKAHQKISEGTGGLAATIDASAGFGIGVAGSGDINGDGNEDIAVGAYWDDDGGTNRGAAYVLFLDTDGTVLGEQKISDTEGGFTATLDNSDELGTAIGAAGDIDGDGVPDLLVGAPKDDDGASISGAVYVLFLNATGTVKGHQKIGNLDGDLGVTLDGSDQFGFAVAGIGDLDEDGTIGIAVGVYGDDDGGPADRGAVYVLDLSVDCLSDADADGLANCWEAQYGDTDGDTTPNELDADDDGDGTPTASENADPNGDGDPRDAADSERDGQPDWLDDPITSGSLGTVDSEVEIASNTGGFGVTLSDYDSFGAAVASAGDLNGDGRPELVATAPGDDDTNSGSGAAYVLFLNADGTVAKPQKISNLDGGLTMAWAAGDGYGDSVAGIGDIDGDGIPDLAVGAYDDDDGGFSRGGVVVLFMTASGTVRDEQLISHADGGGPALDDYDSFGAVTGLGDLDGDGVNDIAIGAYGDDDLSSAGAVWIVFLNEDGTAKATQKISATAGGFGGSLDSGDSFGRDLAGLGDVDGDGRPDLAVGVRYDDDGGSNRGAVHVLFLNTDGTVKAEQKISAITGGLASDIDNSDYLGESLAGVGDLDLDGTPDLVVGATADDDGGANRGAVHVLFLNPDGTVGRNTKISDAAGGLSAALADGDDFGSSVTGLGDLDGDGVTDLAVGAQYRDTGGTSRGSVFVLLTAADLPSTTAIVNSTADTSDASPGDGTCETATPGECTLRAAIEEANASTAVDLIDFAIPQTDPGYTAGPDAFTFTPASPYPTITERITITGSTQAEYVDQPVIVIDGSSAGTTNAAGLHLDAGSDGSVIKALNINSYDDYGIRISESGHHVITGMVLGLERDGTTAAGNRYGVYAATAMYVTFGGTGANEGNVVASGQWGLAWYNDSIRGTFEANRIGTDVTGLLDRGQSSTGVFIVNSAAYAQVGGPTAAHANVVAGSGGDGIYAGSGTMVAPVIEGNLVGVGADGTTPIPIGGHGIELGWGSDGQVLDNVVGPSGLAGIAVANHDGAVVQGNLIGTDSGRTETWVMGGAGIELGSNVDEADIGGTGAGEANVITNATGAGIAVSASAGTDNQFVGNVIVGNGGLGIDLGDDGVTANDTDDVDAGPNDLLNFPVIVLADESSPGTLTVDYLLDGPAGTYDVHFYANPAGADASGHGEGEVYLATDIVVKGASLSGHTDTFAGSAGDLISATASLRNPPLSNTSEFSETVTATTTTIVVNATGDGADATPGDEICDTGGTNSTGHPECTLRAAIEEANASATIDTIHFHIPITDGGHSGGVWTISPTTTAFDAVTSTTVIDAQTQPGWTQDPIVVLDLGGLSGSLDGFRLEANGSTLRGFVIHSGPDDGVELRGSGGHTVAGNWIGLEADGATAAGMSDDGIVVQSGSTGNTIGGPNAADRNATSANGGEGVLDWQGGNLVEGNHIGTDAAGLLDRGNGDEGLDLNGAPSSTVRDNVISGNGGEGVQVLSSDDTVFTGNLIGVGADGTTALGNDGDGVTLNFGDSTSVRFGGTGAGDGNTIAHNGDEGVSIFGSSTDDISSIGNSIHSNTSLGWDIEGDGVTPNDAGDGDGGPNRRLNFPVITAGLSAGPTVTLDFELDAPAGDYRIEVFTNPSGADASGHGEGEVFEAASTITHTGSGAESFQIAYTGSAGDVATLSATEDLGGGTFGSTSEHSAAYTVALDVTAVVNSTGDTGDATPGDGVCDTGGTNSEGDPECTLRAAIEEANAGPTDTIDFAIPTSDGGHSAGIWTMTPASPYDDVVSPVAIDATTQPGWSGDPVIELDGTGATGATAGIRIQTDDSSISGLIVHSFPDEGLEIDGSLGSADRNVLTNNWIGFDATLTARPNADAGILVTDGASDNVVGGTTPGDANVIGNGANVGIVVRNPTSNDNTIVGNLIGVGPDGVTPMPNSTHGVAILDSSTGNVVGGTAAGAGNTIHGNGGDGVSVTSAGASAAILGNSIVDNAGLGIDIDDDGITANDGGDGDVGANDLLNFPVITAATPSGTDVDIDFDLDVPAGDYRVELFSNPSGADLSGQGEGEIFLGATTVTHTGSGVESFSHTVSGPALDVAATATEDLGGGLFGSSSEYSAFIPVAGQTTVTVNSTGDTGDATPGDGGCDTGGTNADGDSECTLRAAIEEANATIVDTIDFGIPATDPGHGGGVWTISPTASYDNLTETVDLDARTQPGWAGDPIVEVDGSSTTASLGLHLIGAPNSTIAGFSIGDYTWPIVVQTTGATIADNWVGVRPDGTSLWGVPPSNGLRFVNNGDDAIVAGNVVVDATTAGLYFWLSDNVLMTGNIVGRLPDGLTPAPNAVGVLIEGSTTDATIGGSGTGQPNLIADNTGNGVSVASGVRNTVLENTIVDNGGLGIDLVGGTEDGNGVTANDAGDGDSGPNDLLNNPVLTGADESGGTVTVTFDLDVPVNVDGYRVQFWANPSGADGSGHGEGETYLGFTDVAGPVTGATFDYSGAVGDVVTATATAKSGVGFESTSEFSNAQVASDGTTTVNSTGDAADATPGDGACDTGGTNSEGDPECTLRAAIEEANASSLDAVGFAIPTSDSGHSAGVWTIAPSSALPAIAVTVTIDASTQAGWTSTPVVELDGTSAGVTANGFEITGANAEIRAFAINRFSGDGVKVRSGSSGGVVIAGNHIGLDASGLIGRGNGGRGVDLQSGSGPTTVGGTLADDRNVISGNTSNGIIIWSSDDNVVINNYVGTDVTGNASGAGIGNGNDGVFIGGTSAGNIVGQPGLGNVLAGNGHDGFETNATGAGSTVQANTIGLGADGTTVLGNGRHGVVIYNGANTNQIGGSGALEGNLISGNTSSGIVVDGAANAATTGNVIAGNAIGVDTTGALDRGNGDHGIRIFSGANATVIGGPTAAHGNVISGNGSGSHAGVSIEGSSSSDTVVQHNLIGTNAAGTAAIPNSLHGVAIDDAPDTDVLDNLISGNDVHGVYVFGSSTTGTEILRNTIGTNASVDAALPNGFDGIRLEGDSTGTTVGSPGNGNVIAGNSQRGITINDNDDNTIQGNWIGTDTTATAALGNTLEGIYTDAFNSSTNLIGGTGAGAGNTIAFNGGSGITFDSGTDNGILGNEIHDNGGLGIDLVGGTEDVNGVTANDAGDGDTGPNDLLNAPVIRHALDSGATVTVDIDLDVPAGDYRIELFTNPSGADPSGHGEAESFQASEWITHTGAGVETFSTTFSGAVGDIVTATATEDLGAGSYGSTSELSAAATVTDDAVVTVNSTGDSADATPGDDRCDTGATNSDGAAECTLRAAIQEANASTTVDTVEFDVPTGDPGHSGGVWTISPTAGLPQVTADLTLDATTQPSWSTTPVVELDGAAATGASGFNVNATTSIIGFAIHSFDNDGITVGSGGGSTAIERNHIGTDADGLTPLGNGDDGIQAAIAINVGGTNPDTGNVIVDNGDDGISLGGVGGSTVFRNTIGLGADGTTPLGNADNGVRISVGTGTSIGAGAPGFGNTISANGGDGVYIDGIGVAGHTIAGNRIGTDATGMLARGNGDRGVHIDSGATSVTVGGTTALSRNIISANLGGGVIVADFSSLGTNNNTIVGNWIGVDATGTGALGNQGHGVQVGPASNTTIGGTAAGAGNVIANAQWDGIEIMGTADTVTVLGNDIHGSGALGIDVDPDGVNLNDAGDADIGVNDLLNFPVIGTVQRVGGDLIVALELDVPAGDYRIELFGNTAADASGYGEGETFLGGQTVTHTGSGSETFQIAVTSPATILTATATEDLGGGNHGATSEFSAAVNSPDLVIVNSTGDAGDTTSGDGQCDTGATNALGDEECTLRAAIEEANDPATPVDTIWFDIPSADPGHSTGVWTVSPASDLPTVTDTTTIDGTTQPGHAGTPVVMVDGTALAGVTPGLEMTGSDSVLSGLALGNFPQDAVVADGADAQITGMYVGVEPDGATGAPNSRSGIVVSGDDVVVGGSSAGQGNVVANSANHGINVSGDRAIILGNLVGVVADGTTPGPNATGVLVNGAVDTNIGGTGAGEGNTISGNASRGVLIQGAASGTTIEGNHIGVASDGTTPAGNGAGVADDSTVGGTTIGGTDASAANVIAHNSNDGILVTAGGTDPAVLVNTVFANGDLGIDHDNDGVSANDSGDADGLPNAPVLISAVSDGSVTSLEFSLDVVAGTYRIDVYENPGGADPSGYGEGEIHVASFDISHPGGATLFTRPVSGGAGDVLTLTASATAPFRSTSEFSNAITSASESATTLLDAGVRRSDVGRLRGAVADQPGVVGAAIDFPGGSSRLRGPALDVTSGALTLGASVHADTLVARHAVISKLDSSGSVVYELGVDGTTGEAVAAIRVGGGTVTARGGVIGTAAWHDLAATWDGADLVLHVDGTEVDRVAAVGVLATDPQTAIAIGNRADLSRPFDGRIDHVTVRHRAVSAAEVTAIHRAVDDPASFLTVGAEQTSTPGVWTVSGTETRSGAFALEAPQTAGADAAAWAVATGIDEPGLVFESWWWISDDSGIDLDAGTRAGLAPTDQYEAALTSPSGWELRSRAGVVESTDAAAAGTPSTGSWVKVEIWTDQLGDSRILIDGVEVTGWTSQGGTLSSGSAGLRVGALPGGESWFVDDARARKLITPEPLTTLSSLDRN